MSGRDFALNLAAGQVGESAIARWLISRGFTVLPAYEKEPGDYKGPRVYSASGNMIAPDLLAFRFGIENTRDAVFWIEAKTKAAFTWHRISRTYQDGIDRRCWQDYLRLQAKAPWPIWLMFLHVGDGVAKDNPEGLSPPTGLFGEKIATLRYCVHHESDKHGPSGMVYWTVDSFRKLAEAEELDNKTR